MGKIKLILDWDGTITVKDTLSVVAQIGFRRNFPKQEFGTHWKRFVDAYLRDLETHTHLYQPREVIRTTIAQESAYLASLRPIEDLSIQRVEDFGTFENLETKDFDNGVTEAIVAGVLDFRRGWDEIMCSGHDIEFGIISVNWSDYFVKYAVKRWVELNLPYGIAHTVFDMERIKFAMNDVARPFSGIPPSGMKVRTSKDKLDYAKSFVQLVEHGAMPMADATIPMDTTDETSKAPLIYVGDSTTDFDCLLYADVGICIRDSPMEPIQTQLADTFKRLNIQVLPLSFLPLPLQSGQGEKIVWWVEDLREVSDLISRIEKSST
ncbi:hypothetical protein EJ08DRAFT_654076 [Tothia fuscella]|uniref:Haloacid dehalogenase-like hydrolase n=1 Tax=Tothia fuscella TaxID=1048955 RepID=A0A9P4NFX6_9PEZI|nr:hypothetical protein EJ08DRAFT_654076 [Tothia fuscella]